PRTDAVAHTDVLARNHFGARQACLDLAGIDNDITLVHALDRARDDGLATLEEVVQDLLAFCITDFLQDGLFGGLSADATEFFRLERLFDVLADLDTRNDLLGLGVQLLLVRLLQAGFVRHDQPAAKPFMLSGLAIDGNPDVGVFLEALLHGGGQRAFKRTEDHFPFDILFTRQGVDQKKNFATHRFLPLKSKMGSSLARSTSSNVNPRTWTSPDWVSYSRPKVMAPDACSCWAACNTPVKTLRSSTAWRRRIS